MATSLDGSITTTYCDPIDVCKAIRIIDYYDSDNGILRPSDSSLPDYDELCYRITVAENFIDRYTFKSWKEHREDSGVVSIGKYWHDVNGRPVDYWMRGGNYVQLHKNIREWDPSKGDSIQIRTLGNAWKEVGLGNIREDCPYEGCCGYERAWFDYVGGRLFIRQGLFLPTDNAIRIRYRWGSEEPVPPEIKRATALKVGLTLLNEELYLTKLGTGGDLGGAKNDMKRGMQDEINEILMMHRTFTGAVSVLE